MKQHPMWVNEYQRVCVSAYDYETTNVVLYGLVIEIKMTELEK